MCHHPDRGGMEEFDLLTAGLSDIIIFSSNEDKKQLNRGFCFLEYESHTAAIIAKRNLIFGMMKVYGCDIIVNWADPQEEPDQNIMDLVRILYCRGLAVSVREETLREMFQRFGSLERIKKTKDFALCILRRERKHLSRGYE